MNSKDKKFTLFDTILTVICVVFDTEAAASVASVGNSQYFWWLLMMVTFLLPFGLIAAELGTAYPGSGGMYSWIRKAYPHGRISGLTAWCYWVNFPLWLASLAVLCPYLVGTMTGLPIHGAASLLLQLAFIWAVVYISFSPISDNAWILNGCAGIKVLLAVVMGGLGIFGAITHGVANPYTAASLLPSFDLHSLSFISVIIFNYLGFEVICTFADHMENPRKQIPQAIIAGGIATAAICLFCAFGIGVAIPFRKISSDSGLLDAMMLLIGKTGGPFIAVMALFFLITLFGNMISWSLGVNNVASCAADYGDLPRIFSRRSAKTNMPMGATVMNGIVASAVVLIGGLLPDISLFWCFFALNLVMFLLSYLPMFPAFLKLRKEDPDRERPFRVPGGRGILTLMTAVPMILIVAAVIFTAIPLSTDAETLSETLPITIGSVICLVLGDLVTRICGRNRKKGGIHSI